MLPDYLSMTLPFLASQAGNPASGWTETTIGREDWLPGAIAALGIAMISTVLLRRWFKKTRTAKDAPSMPIREQREQLQKRSERDSLDRLMVEVQELTRVCAAQIENRATKLEHLIDLADQRLRELEAACDSARTVRLDPQVEYRRDSAPTQREPVGSASRSRDRDWSAEGDPVDVVDRRSGDQLSRRIHELSQMGLKSIEIARQLDEQVGKVELILALREAS